MDGIRPAFATAVGLTVWLAGLLVAFMLGAGSVYLIVSAIFVGSKAIGRLRGGAASGDALGPGDRG